jgi:hypothetical protein
VVLLLHTLEVAGEVLFQMEVMEVLVVEQQELPMVQLEEQLPPIPVVEVEVVGFTPEEVVEQVAQASS